MISEFFYYLKLRNPTSKKRNGEREREREHTSTNLCIRSNENPYRQNNFTAFRRETIFLTKENFTNGKSQFKFRVLNRNFSPFQMPIEASSSSSPILLLSSSKLVKFDR